MDWKEIITDAYQPVLLISGALSGTKMWLDIRKARRELKPKDSQIQIATQDEVSRYGSSLYGLLTALLIGGAVFPFFSPGDGQIHNADIEVGVVRVDAPPVANAESGPPNLPGVSQPDARADATNTFRKGYDAYLAGDVHEGILLMERADAMGAPGARSRLCAIYRKPTAAEGKDFLKEATKCKGVD